MSNTTIPQNGWTTTKPPKKKRGWLKLFMIMVAAGITVLIIVIIALMALIGSSMESVEEDAKANAISKAEFRSVDEGDSIESVMDRFGPPSNRQVTKSGGVKYVNLYYPVDNDQLLDDYQLSFENGQLVSKADY
ncbi:MAG: hypothetical protein ACRDQD_30040 [Nocardioidaceae bacterium]